MAFTKTPSFNTYQTKPVYLLSTLDNRDSAFSKDRLALNGYFDLFQDNLDSGSPYRYHSRDGLSLYTTMPSTNIRGMHYWRDIDKLYVAYDSSIAIYTASTGALITTVTPFISTTGDVGFTEFTYDTGITDLVVSDGTRIATISSANVLTVSSDPDIPVPHSPHIVYFDGYLFTIKLNTADIYNSGLNTPLDFIAGDFISAEMSPDTSKRLIKINNYLVVFGSASIEYFYNAGNATGTPLQRNDTLAKEIGFLGGLSKTGNSFYFVGYSPLVGYDVYEAKNSDVQPMSNWFLRRYLQLNSSFYTSIVSFGGHDFYVLTGTFASDTISFALDLKTKLITRFCFQQEADLPIQYSQSLTVSGIGEVSLISLNGKAGLYYFNPNNYQDNSVAFTTIVQTEPLLFDTMNSKFMSKVVVIADRPTTTANLDISYTDDDYQTFSSSRSVNLNQEYPVLHQWGRFRKRAFRLSFTNNAPLRLKYLEVDYNLGLN